VYDKADDLYEGEVKVVKNGTPIAINKKGAIVN
jgi:hypothetical protein